MRLAQILFSQGFGTRRECAGLIQRGEVAADGRVLDDPQTELDLEGLQFEVQGRRWTFHERALILLHKPTGHECSRRPRHHPSVLSLLPQPLRTRGVQPVGRLDEDTTGLLLLTDDGALIHRVTSPRHHVHKVYEVEVRHPISEAQLTALREGVVLDDDPAPVSAVACEATGEHQLRLTLDEGRYHQVKRMLAAVGNRVERLHRSGFGGLWLEATLAPGAWRWVDAAERATLLAPPPAEPPASAQKS